jgi:hypothetical protein
LIGFEDKNENSRGRAANHYLGPCFRKIANSASNDRASVPNNSSAFLFSLFATTIGGFRPISCEFLLRYRRLERGLLFPTCQVTRAPASGRSIVPGRCYQSVNQFRYSEIIFTHVAMVDGSELAFEMTSHDDIAPPHQYREA